MIVDDEKEIADLLAVYLKAENYEVRTFYNPLEALSCVEKEQVDLAILDVMMPDRADSGTVAWRYSYPCYACRC